MSASTSKQKERPVPLRLTEAVPYEDHILRLYKATPRGRRSEWLRALLKRGLDSMIANGELQAYPGYAPVSAPAFVAPAATFAVPAALVQPAAKAFAPAAPAAPAVVAPAPIAQPADESGDELPDARTALAGFTALATGGKSKK